MDCFTNGRSFTFGINEGIGFVRQVKIRPKRSSLVSLSLTFNLLSFISHLLAISLNLEYS
jgi:hypothetical protein